MFNAEQTSNGGRFAQRAVGETRDCLKHLDRFRRERLLPRCEAVAGCNLGREIRGVRAQLDAMVQRVQGLASAHPKPMPANPLGPPTPGSCGTSPYLSQLLAPAGEGERG
jgi:hypothetical protein